MVHECKQCTTTPRTHVKKNFQVNTFHDHFKAWKDFYRHCVCPWSYLKYTFSFYKVKLWQSNRGIPWRSWCYLICIITRGLCSYNARLFNDDVTAIGVSYWRRREFPNYARLHRGRMSSDVHSFVKRSSAPTMHVFNTHWDILLEIKWDTLLQVTKRV